MVIFLSFPNMGIENAMRAKGSFPRYRVYETVFVNGRVVCEIACVDIMVWYIK